MKKARIFLGLFMVICLVAAFLTWKNDYRNQVIADYQKYLAFQEISPENVWIIFAESRGTKLDTILTERNSYLTFIKENGEEYTGQQFMGIKHFIASNTGELCFKFYKEDNSGVDFGRRFTPAWLKLYGDSDDCLLGYRVKIQKLDFDTYLKNRKRLQQAFF